MAVAPDGGEWADYNIGPEPYGLYLKIEGIRDWQSEWLGEPWLDSIWVTNPPGANPAPGVLLPGVEWISESGGAVQYLKITGNGTVEFYSTDIGWAFPPDHDVGLSSTDAEVPGSIPSEPNGVGGGGYPWTWINADGQNVELRSGAVVPVWSKWDIEGHITLTVAWYSAEGWPGGQEPEEPEPEPEPEPPITPPTAPTGPREPVPAVGTTWMRCYAMADIQRILPAPGHVLATAQPTEAVVSERSTVYYALSGSPPAGVVQLQDVDPEGFDEPQPISHNADETFSALRVRPSPSERLVAILPGGDLAITYVAEDNSTTPFPMPKESIYPNWDSWQNFGPNDAAWIDDEVLVMGGFFTRDEVGQDLYLECARRTGWSTAMTWDLVPVSAQPFDTVRALAYHQGTGLLAVGDSEANLYLYRMVNGTLSMVDSPTQSPIFFGTYSINDLAWNPAGDRLAVAVTGPSDESGGLFVYSVVNDGLNVVRQNLPEMGFRSDSCSFSHTGEYLAAMSFYLVEGGGYAGTYPNVWRTSDWVEVFIDDPDNWLVTSLVTAWSPTENRLLAVGEEQIAS